VGAPGAVRADATPSKLAPEPKKAVETSDFTRVVYNAARSVSDALARLSAVADHAFHDYGWAWAHDIKDPVARKAALDRIAPKTGECRASPKQPDLELIEFLGGPVGDIDIDLAKDLPIFKYLETRR
jgi:hypothetical protein